jgi:hypothetical protein
MRHRISTLTGFGNSSPVILNNLGKFNKSAGDLALETYFPEGFDFTVLKDSVLIGREPAYQFEKLFVIEIARKKENSYFKRGKAFGPYGTQIVYSHKRYYEFKYRSKFVKFIDQIHPLLFSK